MKISLIMPTLGRICEVKEFLESLVNQSYKNFELIVIDQNSHDKVKEICNTYEKKIVLKYVKSNKKGLSLNRNIGLKYATGEIIAFPDDDCEYSYDILEKVKDFFLSTKYDFFSCNTKEKNGDRSIANFLKESTLITKKIFYKIGCSITIFIKYKNLNDIFFDEELGVGAKYGSGEESDLILSLLNLGYRGYYNSTLYIFHPYKQNDYNVIRGYNYALGFGALHKKEFIQRKNKKILFRYLYYLIRNILALLISKNKQYYYTVLKGKIKGFIDY